VQCPALRRYFDELLRTPVLLIIPSVVDPPVRGAGLAPWVKVERPTGRTTLTRGAWSARLARVDGGRDDQARPQPPRALVGNPRSSRSLRAPAGGNIDARTVRLGSQCRWALITCGGADL
jgi:hypothetical protein